VWRDSHGPADDSRTAAARARAAGDVLGTLNRVALRDNAPAPALRGIIAMAQVGDLVPALPGEVSAYLSSGCRAVARSARSAQQRLRHGGDGATSANVDTVFIGGEIRKWKGRLVKANEDSVLCEARKSRDCLAAAAGLWKLEDILRDKPMAAS
jgi:hypothetical protein